MRKLLAKRGRFYFHREPGLTQSIRDAGLEGKMKILPHVMDVQGFYFVASKGLGPEATGMLEQAVARLSASGELTLLLRKWYEQ